MPIVDCTKEKYDVYIGRGGPWGNPFVIGKDGSRIEVIEKYREWIQKQPKLMATIHQLHGKTLGCFCGKQRCHGEVLLQLAAERAKAVEGRWKEIFEQIA